MSVSAATFNRLKDKGVSHFRAGEYKQARSYLIQASEAMVRIAEKEKNPKLRAEREKIARDLIALAKECNGRSQSSLRRRPVTESEDNGVDANQWIVRDKPKISFDHIAGLDDVKEEIRLKMIYPLRFPEAALEYGINLGGGVLLYGPPGTGKTMIAKAIAREIDATFFVVSSAQILSKWVGDAEQNITRLFDAAKSEKSSVIFIDEIEALAPRRKSSGSTVMQRVVPQILQELEGFDRQADRSLLFLGATNKPWMLDEAMMRPGRFDTKVLIPLPDAPARYRMLEMYLAEKRPLADDLDLGLICDQLDGFSGADIKNIADRAAAKPFMRMVGGAGKEPITMQDIEEVLAESSPSVHQKEILRYKKFAETGV